MEPTVEVLDAPKKRMGGRREGAGQKRKEVFSAAEQAHIDQKHSDARLAAAKADREELKFLQESGQWIPREEVRTAVATAFSAICQTMRSVPDALERRFALSPEVVEEVGRMIDESLDGLSTTLESMVEKDYL